jgi:hypothetical protein
VFLDLFFCTYIPYLWDFFGVFRDLPLNRPSESLFLEKSYGRSTWTREIFSRWLELSKMPASWFLGICLGAEQLTQHNFMLETREPVEEVATYPAQLYA